MAFAFGKELSEALANHLLRNTQHTSPSAVYLALHDDGGASPGDPGETAAAAYANEAVWTSYARQAISFAAPTGSGAITIANSTSVVFPAVDASEGPFDITGISLWTADRGGSLGASGDMLFQGAIDAVKTLDQNDAISWAVGKLVITID